MRIANWIRGETGCAKVLGWQTRKKASKAGGKRIKGNQGPSQGGEISSVSQCLVFNPKISGRTLRG